MGFMSKRATYIDVNTFAFDMDKEDLREFSIGIPVAEVVAEPAGGCSKRPLLIRKAWKTANQAAEASGLSTLRRMPVAAFHARQATSASQASEMLTCDVERVTSTRDGGPQGSHPQSDIANRDPAIAGGPPIVSGTRLPSAPVPASQKVLTRRFSWASRRPSNDGRKALAKQAMREFYGTEEGNANEKQSVSDSVKSTAHDLWWARRDAELGATPGVC